ncbi:MAG: indole-3-glycerol phosphate synthase TrpC [Alphaproteobacteria bacterium]|nr:indole-3-glycerol phosphate synthase TrpC [Alphaproteobacteria bacterium]
MSVLDEICARKRDHIQDRMQAVSLAEIKKRAAAASPPAGFISALRAASGPAIIAEIKKASPSKGLIREDFDPASIAQAYQRGGAACLSVLTDEPYFQGRDAYLQQAKAACPLPALRKDFMLDEYQIYESRALGTDCVLLIMAALSNAQAVELHDLSRALGMDVLVEIHDREELDRALPLAPAMIGVNNRNLKTLAVDVQTSMALAPLIPPGILKIAESGIGGAETIRDLQNAGYDGFLIGESLMRQPCVETALKILLTGC